MANLKKLKQTDFEPVIHILIITLVILFIINFIFMFSLTSVLNNKYDDAIEAAKPALIQLTIIDNNCKDCASIDSIITEIKKTNVNVTSEKILSINEAVSLISKYHIQKLPSLIVTGEINKKTLKMLTQSDDALVYTNNQLPSFDISKNKIIGLVYATIIKANDCKECFDPNLMLNGLKSSGVFIKDAVNLDEESAKETILKYNLTVIPTLILNGDVSSYPNINNAWTTIIVSKESIAYPSFSNVFYKVSTKQIDGSYLFTSTEQMGTYKDLSTNKI